MVEADPDVFNGSSGWIAAPAVRPAPPLRREKFPRDAQWKGPPARAVKAVPEAWVGDQARS
jgi:hypothetical protein